MPYRMTPSVRHRAIEVHYYYYYYYHSIGLKVKEKQESNPGRQSDDRKGENSRGEG